MGTSEQMILPSEKRIQMVLPTYQITLQNETKHKQWWEGSHLDQECLEGHKHDPLFKLKSFQDSKTDLMPLLYLFVPFPNVATLNKHPLSTFHF